jgi:hypothetical protein
LSRDTPKETALTIPDTSQVVRAFEPGLSAVPILKYAAGSLSTMRMVACSDRPPKVAVQLDALDAPVSWRSMLAADGTVQDAFNLLPFCDQVPAYLGPPDPQPQRQAQATETRSREAVRTRRV